jgi:hypothetical protein
MEQRLDTLIARTNAGMAQAVVVVVVRVDACAP